MSLDLLVYKWAESTASHAAIAELIRATDVEGLEPGLGLRESLVVGFCIASQNICLMHSVHGDAVYHQEHQRAHGNAQALGIDHHQCP